jgi:hypothetical protein
MVEIYVRGHLAVECRVRPSHPAADPGSGQAPRRPSVRSGRDRLEDSATPALIGSLTGGAFDLAPSWLTLRGRVPAQPLVQQAAKRGPSTQNSSSKRPDALPMPRVIRPKALRLSPISVVQRMRLTSSDEFIALLSK